jgi:hypothetical protein
MQGTGTELKKFANSTSYNFRFISISKVMRRLVRTLLSICCMTALRQIAHRQRIRGKIHRSDFSFTLSILSLRDHDAIKGLSYGMLAYLP